MEQTEMYLPQDVKMSYWMRDGDLQGCTFINPIELALKKQKKIDTTRLLQAEAEANNSNCVKHSVGCIITDVEGRILSSGYNGTPSGHQNCSDRFPKYQEVLEDLETRKDLCEYELGEKFNSPQDIMLWEHRLRVIKDEINAHIMKHRDWSMQHEIHAEVNALMNSDPMRRRGGTLYVNLQPCENCAKMIAGSGLARVVYGRAYHRANDDVSVKLFKDSNIEYIHLENILPD